MKVLFAVSNDNITTSVVKKYQQKYKEIITNKNVYYFNAIVKELQKDKSYDAIVIEEDLEPISNNNYEAIDKFLSEKLDSISDEAAKPTGEDIPIIFICADRRTVSDKLLIKLFSMGIYNALVGNDRSLDKLCELIAKPRSKKDAKKYYKIEVDKAEYQSQKDEIVSEDQIQNILNYYKKIGSNERKCVQAFDSISKQYDSTQLRIIVKFLPMDVKAILEARSPVYQRLMSNGTVLSNGQYSAYTPNNPKKPEKLGFVSKDLNTSSAKPRAVVIPTNMKVQQSEEKPEENNGYYAAAQQRMNQQYGQYNQNSYGSQNGMGQYNQYNQMRQNPYGNMYGQMQNNNPYGMGNNMGQQMNANRMQQRPGYNPYQQNYNNNYQQNMGQQGIQNQMQNQYNQNMNSNNNRFQQNQQSQQNGYNQDSVNQQQNMNKPQEEVVSTQNNFQNQNSFNNQNVQQVGNQITDNANIDNQTENLTNQTQPINGNSANQIQESTMQTQLADNNVEQQDTNSIEQNNSLNTIDNNNQLINQEENTSIIKQEENQSLIKNDEVAEEPIESVQPISLEEVQDSTDVQEAVEPVKRRRGRPRKVKVVEEEVVPQVKRRRGRPRKNPIVEESVTDNLAIEEIEAEQNEQQQQAVPQVQPTQQQVEPQIHPQQQVEQPFQLQQQEQQPIQQSQQFQPQQQIQQQTVIQNIETNNEEETSQIDQNEVKSTLPFRTSSAEEDNDVSLNDLKSVNSVNNNSQAYNNVQNDNNTEQQLYRKPDEIKPINLYDLDIDSEDMFGDNQNVDLGVEPIDEFKIEEETASEDTPISQLSQNQTVTSYMSENTDLVSQQRKDNDYDISSPIAGSGKIVAFVGTSKNGTSFIINNVALLLADSGINTAVVDLTKNKNSYYMFTDNDAGKTKIATESLSKLSEGIVQGLTVKNNLTIFTALPENHEEDSLNPRTVLESLNNRFDVVLLDCDFKTHEAYFAFSNEIFLTQSMDAFTIQPLTKFLSDLKLKNILNENKLRIVINKYVKLKKLDAKMIVGGMSKYNEPSMTLQRDLFDPKKIKVITIPFDNQTYTKYLESIALCQVSVNGYSREVVDGLEKIKNLVYPLVAGNGRGSMNTNNYTNNNNFDYNNQRNSQGFSSSMNDTLNKMRTNNF